MRPATAARDDSSSSMIETTDFVFNSAMASSSLHQGPPLADTFRYYAVPLRPDARARVSAILTRSASEGAFILRITLPR